MPVVDPTLRSLAREKVTAAGMRLGKSDYERLAAFRHALRCFLSFSQAAARDIGLASQQYQALLAIRGCPGRDAITIDGLARQLLIKHNSAVGLVDRLQSEGLVQRQADSVDRRRVEIVLTAKGNRAFERLAVTHHAELTRIGPQLRGLLSSVLAAPRKGGGPRRRQTGPARSS